MLHSLSRAVLTLKRMLLGRTKQTKSTETQRGPTRSESLPRFDSFGEKLGHLFFADCHSGRKEISALFDRWNRSLQTGDPHKVVANYAERSILLPTVSNKPRLPAAEKEDYFHHFLENKPVGKIDSRTTEIGCSTAVDSGLYTFTYGTTGAQVKARYTFTYKWDGKAVVDYKSSLFRNAREELKYQRT